MGDQEEERSGESCARNFIFSHSSFSPYFGFHGNCAYNEISLFLEMKVLSFF